MRLTPAIGRIIFFTLALVLAATVRPAEGLTFFEQHEPFTDPLSPELRPDPTQAVIDLSGPWECITAENKPSVQTWIPSSYLNDGDELAFRRTFALPESLRTRNLQLFVPEASYRVQVWVNGRMISSFAGSHLGFSCDISPELLRFGDANELVLKVSSRLSPRETLPLAPQATDPSNYGGIFSGVYLRAVPTWSIEGMRVVQRKTGSGGQINADVVVRIARYVATGGGLDSTGAPKTLQLYVSIRDSVGTLLSEAHRDLTNSSPDSNFQATVSLPAFAATLWTPKQPMLYRLATALVAGNDTLHREIERIGFKRLEVNGADIYLNGEKLRLQGMDYIPEHPLGGRAIAASMIRSDLTAMKDLGVNLVRVPHSPPPPALVNLADEMGMLLLVEAGVDRIPAKFIAQSGLREHCERSYSELVRNFSDHVSVLAWGIGAELDWKDPGTEQFNEWLYGYVQGLDGRPCYTESMDPLIAGRSDIVLLAMAPASSDSVSLPASSDQPLIVTGLGKPVTPGDPTQRELSSGLINQANFLIGQIGRINAANGIDGYLIHSFADYHGESPILSQPNRSDPYLYSYGVVGLNRAQRIVYFKLRDMVQTGQASPPLPSPVGQNSPLTFPVVGLATLLLVSVEMRRNNVFRQNLKRVFMHPHGFHMDLRYRRFLHTAQPLLLWLFESVTLALLTASLLYAFRNSYALDYYLSLLLPPHWKAELINLVWNPTSALVFFTALYLAKILLLTIAIRIISIPFRERMDFWQATNYVVWSLAALLFLLPVAVILFRTLETPQFVTPSLVLIAVGLLWCAQRLLSSLRTGYGTTAWRIYLGVLMFLGISVAIVVMVLDRNLGLLAYMEYFGRVFRGL